MIDIRALRQEVNISQYEMARRLGVGQGNISHWELRKRPFPKEGIPRLQEEFGEEIVAKYDTLTEDDLKPDYIKKGGLFAKGSGYSNNSNNNNSFNRTSDVSALMDMINAQNETIKSLQRIIDRLNDTIITLTEKHDKNGL